MRLKGVGIDEVANSIEAQTVVKLWMIDMMSKCIGIEGDNIASMIQEDHE